MDKESLGAFIFESWSKYRIKIWSPCLRLKKLLSVPLKFPLILLPFLSSNSYSIFMAQSPNPTSPRKLFWVIFPIASLFEHRSAGELSIIFRNKFMTLIISTNSFYIDTRITFTVLLLFGESAQYIVQFIQTSYFVMCSIFCTNHCLMPDFFKVSICDLKKHLKFPETPIKRIHPNSKTCSLNLFR